MKLSEAAEGYGRFLRHMEIAQRYLDSQWHFASLEAAELAMREEPAMCRHLRHVKKAHPKPTVRFSASVFLWTHLPVVLDHTLLERVEDFHRDQRSTYRHADQDLGKLAQQAKHHLDLAYRVWNHFIQIDRPSNSLVFESASDQTFAHSLCKNWIAMGVLHKGTSPGEKVKWSRLGDEMGATVCRFCGRWQRMTFDDFLDGDQCRDCAAQAGVVWRGEESPEAADHEERRTP